MRTIGLQCLNCGMWFMLASSERRHRDGHAAEMMLTGPAKRAVYEAERRLYRERHPHIVLADHGTKSL